MQKEKRKRGHEASHDSLVSSATPREIRIIEREKRKRGHEASRASLVSSATPREIRIIEREKRKRDRETSRASLVSSATPRGTHIIQREKRKKDKEASRGSLLSTVTPDGEPLFQLPTEKTKRDYLLSLVTPRQERMIERMVQLNNTMDKCNKDYLERFGCPDPPVSNQSFVEKPFGYTDAVCDDSLTSKVVSLALYDGDKMLFACSGVALQRKGMTFPLVSRFVTSKRLVTEFEKNRNRADNLRINVHLPNKASFDGFLGLYDNHIAIVTSFHFAKVLPVDLHSHIDWQHDLVAVGRAFSSGTLMTTARKPIDILSQQQATDALIPFPCPITEAGLGGPVINLAGDVVGLSIEVDIDKETTWFLPRVALRVHLEYLEKLTPNSTNFREYTLPDGVYSIVPSGFMADVNYLKSCGYPHPPPLVLEAGGRLFNTFEEDFGQLYGYKDYDCNLDHRSSGEQVWAKLPKKVVTNIARSVVSLSSYDGDVRYFSCTGLLIKWHKTGTPVILTSASLVRSRVDEDKIDEKLKIKVLLPPNQSAAGILELYHSDYNIAVISLQKPLYGIRPENIFNTVERPCRVAAIGREAEDGLLMGTIGKMVKKRADDKLNCEDLKLSTCIIKKVGIGGPLVSFFDGRFAGMNFYGETDVTPYLPRRIIVEVLSGIDLPSQRGMDHATDIMGDATVKKIRWPVPKPYWYHPLIDDDPPLRFYGRQLQ